MGEKRLFTALVSGLVLCLCLASGALAGQEESFRLGEDVVPTFQAIELTLDADQPDYRGSVLIELEVRRETAEFHVHNEGPELRSVVLKGDAGEIELTHEAAGDDRVRIATAEPLAPGAYTLAIGFTNDFDTQAVSLYRMEKDGQGYAFTQFEPNEAREAFPCFDEPSFKIPYQMTLTVPAGHLAISNTPVLKESVEDGWRTTVFQKSPPLPSYLLAIATGPFETVPIPDLGVPARIVTVKGQSHLAEMAVAATPPLLEALEAYFERPYPYRKLDFIAIPEYWAGAMENAGAVTFSDFILLVAPETATVGQRRLLSRVIAHELAHMWFGDLVTMEWWDDLWLNESFADWMGDKITHQVFPQYDLDITTAREVQRIMGRDALTTAEPIRRSVKSTDNVMNNVHLAYNKGKAVLGMFEQWLGPETFRRGVLGYIEANAWGNAEAADLWRALDEASGKKVSLAMATFIDQPGFPRITVEWLGQGRVKLSQQRFRNHGAESEDFIWQVPITLKYAGSDGAASTTVLLRQASATVQLFPGTAADSAPAWIHANARADGYYRWSLPAEQLQSLAQSSSEVLTPRERVELLGNVTALLNAGAIGGGEYLEALGELADDPEPLVVHALIGALGAVRMAFVPQELEQPFADYVRRTLGPALDRFGRERVDGEKETVALVRSRLYTWLGLYGRNEELLGLARTLASSFMKDPASVDASLAGVALELAADRGDEALFEEFRKRFEAAETPRERNLYLFALGSFGDSELRAAALRYSLEGQVRPTEIESIAGPMGSDPDGRDQLFRFVTESWDQFAERFPPEVLGFMPFLAHGCSAERLQAATEFFAQPEHQAPGTQRMLSRVTEEVNECIQLRSREGAAVTEFLRRSAQGASSQPG